MLIPCIDLQDGQAVQLVHGRKRELAVADVFGLLRKFAKYQWLHIIDLDAATGSGENCAYRAGCDVRQRQWIVEYVPPCTAIHHLDGCPVTGHRTATGRPVG